MNITRLRRLINMLEKVVNDESVVLDMAVWRRLDVSGRKTRCCAFGLATLDYAFQEKGLGYSPLWGPTYDGKSSYDAAQHFFDLATMTETIWIFSPSCYICAQMGDPLAVIDHIHDVMNGRGKEAYKAFFSLA